MNSTRNKKRLVNFLSVSIIFILLIVTFLIVFNIKQVQTLFGHAQTPSINTTSLPGTPGCQFQNGGTPAFCDSFDNPAGTGNRSGDLNGLVWGVSRSSNGNNSPSQLDSWSSTPEDQCGTTVTVQPESDVHICNGRLVEAMDDGTGTTELAMYPTQPFDITGGRTGTVVFDVDADSVGGHSAWPAFIYTDQPIPAPYSGLSGQFNYPRNSFGFSLALSSPCGAGTSGIDSAWITSNYALNTIPFNAVTNCFKFQPGVLNHFEIRMSVNQVDVYGTDAGSTVLKHLITIPNANLPLQKGLIWIADVHYNGNKDGGNQEIHTFNWDNVGFDGPILAGDIHLDVNDALAVNQFGGVNLGWIAPDNTNGNNFLTLQIPGATTTNLAAASGALLTLNYWVTSVATINYRVNGHSWHTMPWPFADTVLYGTRTIGLPVSLSELAAGTNTVNLQVYPFGGYDAIISNVDLILIGARNTGSTSGPTNTPVPTTVNPTATPPSSPNPTNTPTLTPTPLPTGSTIGNTHQGATLDNGDANSMNGTKITTGGNPASVVSISAFVGTVDVSPNNKFQMAIYTDASGIPGTLVAQSSSGTLTANSWNTLPITTTLSANTSYWLMYNTNGSNGNVNNVFFDTASTQIGAFVTSGQPFGTFPANFGAATLGNWNFSVYVSLSSIGGGPTNTPIPPTPTNSPTPTLQPTNTQAPTNTPVPTSTPIPSSASVSLSVKLHGLGDGGDNANTNGVGNILPIHTNRQVSLTVFNSANTQVGTPVNGTLTYQGSPVGSRFFTAIVSLPAIVANGVYTMQVSSPGFLTVTLPQIITLTKGSVTSVPVFSLGIGDLNNDNTRDLLDYNQMLTDYGKSIPSSTTLPTSDLNDDGVVDLKDINLMLREFSAQAGT